MVSEGVGDPRGQRALSLPNFAVLTKLMVPCTCTVYVHDLDVIPLDSGLA